MFGQTKICIRIKFGAVSHPAILNPTPLLFMPKASKTGQSVGNKLGKFPSYNLWHFVARPTHNRNEFVNNFHRNNACNPGLEE
jgi:hypothetical protein